MYSHKLIKTHKISLIIFWYDHECGIVTASLMRSSCNVENYMRAYFLLVIVALIASRYDSLNI